MYSIGVQLSKSMQIKFPLRLMLMLLIILLDVEQYPHCHYETSARDKAYGWWDSSPTYPKTLVGCRWGLSLVFNFHLREFKNNFMTGQI